MKIALMADLHLRGCDLPQTRAQLMASVDVMVERGFGDGIFDRARRTEAEIACEGQKKGVAAKSAGKRGGALQAIPCGLYCTVPRGTDPTTGL